MMNPQPAGVRADERTPWKPAWLILAFGGEAAPVTTLEHLSVNAAMIVIGNMLAGNFGRCK